VEQKQPLRAAALGLVILAFAVMEVGIGGARLLYSIPGVLLIALAGVATAAPGRGTPNPKFSAVGAFSALLFSGYILVRNRLSEIEYIGRQQFVIMAGCFLVYLLFGLFLSGTKDRKRLFHWLLGFAALQVAVGFFQFKEDNQWMPLPWAQRRDDFWRASGLFISPNHFAGHLEILALIGASLLVWGRYSAAKRVLIGYFSAFCVAGLALSGSRGGYLSLLFGGSICLLLNLAALKRLRPERFRRAAVVSVGIALGLVGGIAFLMFQSDVLRERVLQINDPENMRWLLWNSAVEQFKLSPVFGTGAFSFLHFGRTFRDLRVQHDPIHVHNDYLQLLADYGGVGLGLFIVVLGVHLVLGRCGFRALLAAAEREGRHSSDTLALAIGAISAISAYLVHSLFDFNMQIPVNALLVGAVFAVAANPAPGESKAGRRVPFPVSLFGWSLPIFGAAALVYGLPMIRGEYFSERARVAFRDGKFEEALDAARRGVEGDKRNPDLFYYQGEAAREVAFRGLGNSGALFGESVAAFENGLGLFPNDSRLALKLAQAHSDSGDYFAASDAMRIAEELDPHSALVLAYRGYIEAAGEYYDEAEAAFEEARELGGGGGVIAKRGLELIRATREKEEREGSAPDRGGIRDELRELVEAEGKGNLIGERKLHAPQKPSAKPDLPGPTPFPLPENIDREAVPSDAMVPIK
jgi:O-antigen ligase